DGCCPTGMARAAISKCHRVPYAWCISQGNSYPPEAAPASRGAAQSACVAGYGCCSDLVSHRKRMREMPKTKSKTGAVALELLKEDHDRVKKSFKEFEKMDREDTATMEELVRAVCEDLKVHAALEEEIFYPAVRAAIEDEDIMNEAQVEHDTAKMLI